MLHPIPPENMAYTDNHPEIQYWVEKCKNTIDRKIQQLLLKQTDDDIYIVAINIPENFQLQYLDIACWESKIILLIKQRIFQQKEFKI